MPFIPLEEHLPGVTGLLEYRKDSAQPIRELTQFLLRGPNTLTEGERELIATVVSSGNQCTFCTTAHTAATDLLLGENETSARAKQDILTAPVSEKMKALLTIAAMTRESGKSVTAEAIANAKAQGATDVEIHDTVLIAALFCLYNRYVDGMGTALPKDAGYYSILADRLVNHGYTRLPQGYDHLKNNVKANDTAVKQ
ncbi:carboxymuconolactone decarboxylase family protein [Foetidibacter luteolus]|uniref:carboxymuconolactone decarboxylase family protein n=1 Tax=Foetidibacter luteolus TaxID=2608880 RepID=UPI00129BD7DF|nr:carboxymuconolactone decarboxylase family protein [Foetidibacter luteolus]